MARVLIIDDELPTREFLSDVLRIAGHAALCEGDAGAGLAAVADDAPDLVICDVFMPERDGLECIRDIRRRCPLAPILAVSGGGQWELLTPLEIAATGATAVLPKPIAPRTLLHAVGELLGDRPPSPPCCPDGESRAAHAGRVCFSFHTCPRAGSSI